MLIVKCFISPKLLISRHTLETRYQIPNPPTYCLFMYIYIYDAGYSVLTKLNSSEFRSVLSETIQSTIAQYGIANRTLLKIFITSLNILNVSLGQAT